MDILRAKTTGLFSYTDLTEAQQSNIELNGREMDSGATVLASMPQRFVLELTNACNLSCVMCGRQDTTFQPTFFDMAWLDKLAPAMDRTTEVTLFGWGEPTVHPRFAQILEYLHRYPVKKYFVSNGMLLHKYADLIVSTVDMLAVSLDGATPATNDAIRHGADFRKIVENLHGLVAKRDASPGRRPYINFVMTLMKDNLAELPQLVELAHSLGIEEVKAVYLTAFSDHLADQVLFGHRDRVKAVFAEAIEVAERLGVKLKLPFLQDEDPAGEALHKPCFVGWRDFFMGSDGFVRPCQSTPQKFFSIHEHESFESMWNAPPFQAFRGVANDAKAMPHQCSICYQSSHTNWNRRSSYLQNEVSSDFAPEWTK
jgi:MoaA/NifB/PqqE/SkfB family radical SAM enzyme